MTFSKMNEIVLKLEKQLANMLDAESVTIVVDWSEAKVEAMLNEDLQEGSNGSGVLREDRTRRGPRRVRDMGG